MSSSLSKLSDYLITALEKQEKPQESGKINVNPLVSKVASLYEKLRNAMDYREEEVVLRAAIERIIKRRMLLGGTGETIAEPLVRELVWARYFSEKSVSEESIKKLAEKIDVYIRLRAEILGHGKLKEQVVNEWIHQLMSSDVEHILNPSVLKNYIANFMFQILKDQVKINDDSEQTKDAQVFLAIRKSFAKDDIAFLRFHLFAQYFGELTEENVATIGKDFFTGYEEIEKELNYPIKERVFAYINSKTPIFFVLEDLLRVHKSGIRELVQNEDELSKAVFEACSARYAGIKTKVRTAIVRSVIFILLTKAFFAFAVEGSIENILYGGIDFKAMAINVSIPPLLMILVGLLIRTPGQKNSELILNYIKSVLFEDKPGLGVPLETQLVSEKNNTVMDTTFTVLWFLAFLLTFGVLVVILNALNFNIVSQGIFIFFLCVVSFLSYRISLTSKEYSVQKTPGIISPITDFFFMPIIRVGRNLTEGISQINILLFVFDFIIETPFKGIFSFFEQWFFFLHAKREELE